MKVQIFIPTFNRAELLERSARSALAQTCADIEVVILDNHSTDHTAKIASKLMMSDPRVKYLCHPTNIGMNPNFNTVSKMVDGDFFSILTDDDEYEPHFVETALNCFRKFPAAQFVVCDAPTKIRGRVIGSQLDGWTEGFYPMNTAVENCLSGKHPIFTNCLFRYSVKDDVYFPERTENVADAWFLVCLFAKYHGFVSKVVTGSWNNSGENTSSTQTYDPIKHVDVVFSGHSYYRDFCRRNALKMKGRVSSEIRKIRAVLVAASRSDFTVLYKSGCLSQEYGPLMIAVLWGLDKVQFLRGHSAFIRMIKAIKPAKK